MFDSGNPQSILFRHKQSIVTKGVGCKNDFVGCLKFIKDLSANKTFEYALKEYQPAGSMATAPTSTVKSNNKKGSRKGGKNNNDQSTGQPNQNLSNWELTNTITACKIRMQSTFLKHLEEECQRSILEDLLLDDNVQEKVETVAVKATS